MDTQFKTKSPKTHDPMDDTYRYRYCEGVPPQATLEKIILPYYFWSNFIITSKLAVTQIYCSRSPTVPE